MSSIPTWEIINDFIKTHSVVSHQIDTYNNFIHFGLPKIFDQEAHFKTSDFSLKFTNPVLLPPKIANSKREYSIYYPSDARLNNINYSGSLVCDAIEKNIVEGKEEIKIHYGLVLGSIPVMLKSSVCHLSNLTDKECVEKGECKNDLGGYFIIRGNERVLVSQMRANYNTIIVLKQKIEEKYKYIAEVRSMSNETGHSVLVQALLSNDEKTVEFSLPHIKSKIPAGVVFKALGFTSDEDILNIIGITDQKFDKYKKTIIRDAFVYKTQEDACNFIASHAMIPIDIEKRFLFAKQIVENELLPHLGTTATPKEQACFLGIMIRKLIFTNLGLRKEDDRDHYSNKRIDCAGQLVYDIIVKFMKKYFLFIKSQFTKRQQMPDIPSFISRIKTLTKSINQCFATGNWTVQKQQQHVRAGVSQVLDRMTYMATCSHLRRVIIPNANEGKNTAIRQIHQSSIGFICVTGDTKVLQSDGTQKEIRYMNNESSVTCFSLSTQQNSKTQIHNFFKVTPKKLLKITTLSGRVLKCTPEHPLAIFENDSLQWRNAGELKSESVVYQHVREFSSSKESIICRIAGLFESMGYLSPNSNHGSICFEDMEDYTAVFEDLQMIGAKFETKIQPHGRGNLTYHIFISDSLIAQFINLGVHRGNNKLERFPSKILSLDLSLQKEFIDGFMCGVISKCKKNDKRLEYISNIFEIFNRFNIVMGLTDSSNIKFCVLNSEEEYHNLLHFRYSIKNRKESDYRSEFLRIKKLNLISDKDIRKVLKSVNDKLYIPISSIEEIPVEDVYDFTTISEDHSFIANGFVTHNCPCETPEGGRIGLVLNFANSTKISREISTIDVKRVLKNVETLIPVSKIEFSSFSELHPVLLNGIIVGYTSDMKQTVHELKIMRSVGLLDKEIEICYDPVDSLVKIFCDEGRMIRPLYVIDNGKLKIEDAKTTDFETLVREDYIRWVGASELDNSIIAMTPEKLKKRQDYDFCEIHPSLILGLVASMIPFSDHSQSPRNCYQSSMGKQALGLPVTNFKARSDTMLHVLHSVQRPLVLTKFAEMFGANSMPSGQSVIVAILTYTGYNQEDSIIMNQSSIDRGLFTLMSYFTIESMEKKRDAHSYEKICKPPKNSDNSISPEDPKYFRRKYGNYNLLDEDGVVCPRLPDGSPVELKKDDVIIGNVIITSDKLGHEQMVDASIRVNTGEEGTVDRVVKQITPTGQLLVKVIVRKLRRPTLGDKFASRAAQKGTVGMVYRQEDMPFTASGIVPDIIINPCCIPSRMTVNQLIETVLGKECLFTGKYGDATPFTENSTNIADRLGDVLKDNGLNPKGWETLTNGMTGEIIEAKVFIGPTYYQRLKHMVSDKMHARARGEVTVLTRQPLEGFLYIVLLIVIQN